MHAIRLHAFGAAENLRYEELPDPVPSDGQVRIAVEASGVHLIDTTIRRGASGGPFPLPELPMVPGREVAGTVAAVGPGVDTAWQGQRVVAHLGMASGGYAEQAVTAASALHAVPDGLSADVAVAAIGTGRTAAGILEVAGLRPDDVVLVTAAAGGLGGLFLQAARNAGATSVGAAGGEAKVAGLDADVAVDYSRPDWPERVREALGERAVSVVLDGVGGAQGRAALELLRPGGRIVLFGMSSGAFTEITTADLFRYGISADGAIGPRMLQRPGGLPELEARALASAADGTLVPLVGQRFPLEDAAAAHRAIETRATVGKTVLVPSPAKR